MRDAIALLFLACLLLAGFCAVLGVKFHQLERNSTKIKWQAGGRKMDGQTGGRLNPERNTKQITKEASTYLSLVHPSESSAAPNVDVDLKRVFEEDARPKIVRKSSKWPNLPTWKGI
jgi:hypothetical protein